MKKRTLLIVIVGVALAVLATTSFALAKTPSLSKITGHPYYFMEDWGNTEIWNRITINENPRTHALSGLITVKITDPVDVGARYYETTPVCVSTYKGEDGSNWAILVHRITAEGVSGWGPGEPLEYAKWKIHDTGLPGGEGDTMYLAYECSDPNFENTCDTDGDGEGDAPYDEFWPADGEPPACDDADFDTFPLEVDQGNIVIHMK
jgi:hypothetical protein